MPTVSSVQLSLELRATQKRVRDVLRELYGTLPEGGARWQVTEEQADAVRSRLAHRSRLVADSWALEPGDVVRRRAIHDAYGGQQQGGIATPRSIPDILIFTNPETGAEFGYDEFEGLREDGS